MAAGIIEPAGKAAGRVTITTTLTSLLPPFAAVVIVVVCAMLEILDKETAGAVVLGILATAGLTTGTVFTTAKKTPTDQARTIWGSQPVADVVTPPLSFTDPVVTEAPLAGPSPAVDDAAAQLSAEVDAVRGRHASTVDGVA